MSTSAASSYESFGVSGSDTGDFYIGCRECGGEASDDGLAAAGRDRFDVRLSDLIRWADSHNCRAHLSGSDVRPEATNG